MIKALKNFLLLAVFFIAFSASATMGSEYYLHGIGGGGNYIEQGAQWGGVVAGMEGGIQASDELGFEAIIQHLTVDTDDYYFTTIGVRYRFLKADFFMEPSVDFQMGALIPNGKKSDVDGVFGVGAGLLYRTHYKFEFGPKIESVAVFAGPNKNLYLGYMFVVGYRFK